MFFSGYCCAHYHKYKKYGDPLFKVVNSPSGAKEHPLYELYCKIKTRCINENSLDYKNYGGRGIYLDSRWLGLDGFRNFCEDMGGSFKSGLSIDRIDNNKGYSKDNCRWANRHIQNSNRRNNSNHVGVDWLKNNNKWRARVKINKKEISLGCYPTLESAINAREKAEIEFNIYEI